MEERLNELGLNGWRLDTCVPFASVPIEAIEASLYSGGLIHGTILLFLERQVNK